MKGTQDTSAASFKPLWISLCACAVAVILFALAVSLSRVTEFRIDVTSGRVKRTEYVLGARISEREVETKFSEFAPPGAELADGKSWKIYARFHDAQWFWGAENYGSTTAGSARSDLKTFADLCSAYKVPDEECSIVAARLLTHLRAGDSGGIENELDRFHRELVASDSE